MILTIELSNENDLGALVILIFLETEYNFELALKHFLGMQYI